MLAKIVRACVLLSLLLCLAVAAALFAPKNIPAYRLKVGQGQGMAAVSRQLDADGVIYSRHVLLGVAYVLGVQDQIRAGSYRFPAGVSSWRILRHLASGRPDVVTVQVIEGQTFAQMRRIINNTADISHDTRAWSDAELLRQIGAAAYGHGEGLFFPDSYDVDAGGSDLDIYKRAHEKMRRVLQAAWERRRADLPYRKPYELLTLASIIEKETGHPEDRAHVAAVFVNRLNSGMRLQTDPTVIYGMGAAYQGRIRKDDLRRDTPYNTYTRHGLPPTPIALPGKAALEAAAQPSQAQYLYFVSRMDGSGKSQFSHTLDEHNAAVRKYILKKGD